MTVSVSEHKSFYKLIQGDCLKILPTFESQSVDMVVTDPPYGINKDGIINDDLPLKKYRLWMKQIIAEIERITKNAYFIFHSETMLFNLVDLYEDCRLFASCNKNAAIIINLLTSSNFVHPFSASHIQFPFIVNGETTFSSFNVSLNKWLVALVELNLYF